MKAAERKRKKILKTAPTPVKGINLVQKTSEIPVLQALTAREVEAGRKAIWVDVGNRSSTYKLAAHSREAMNNVKITRAFTAFQHHQAVNSLKQFIDQEKVLVLSNFPEIYTERQKASGEKKELFHEAWKTVKQLQKDRNLKVLVTAPGKTEGAFKIRYDADKQIKAEKNSQGWKYSSENFKTSTYRSGKTVQTTIPYWSRREVEKWVEPTQPTATT
ncbi:MAG: hypothetical protein ABEJ83_00370 [Candidatus Nanohaloarchaea archaeon]